jgi:hypothetical protein
MSGGLGRAQTVERDRLEHRALALGQVADGGM